MNGVDKLAGNNEKASQIEVIEMLEKSAQLNKKLNLLKMKYCS